MLKKPRLQGNHRGFDRDFGVNI